jgi:sugar-phosphatase
MQHRAKGLLFDNDGVLSDSLASVDAAWAKWSEKYSPNFVISFEHHGRRAREIIQDLLPQDEFEQAHQLIEKLEIELTYLTKAMPGAIELTSMSPIGSWTVVTSATLDLAKARLNKAGIRIPAELITGDDVSHGKPNPEPYLKAAEKLRIPIQDCVVFEDAPNGIAAGVGSGAGLVVGVGQEALETQANLVVKSLQGISFDGKELSIPEQIRLR